jgi:hypothetical protein
MNVALATMIQTIKQDDENPPRKATTNATRMRLRRDAGMETGSGPATGAKREYCLTRARYVPKNPENFLDH